MHIDRPTPLAQRLRPAQRLPLAQRSLLLILGTAALLAGLYGRFKGIGTWPLGVDEFYISRSIDNVLQTGLPRFPCGGYYIRGLIFQYLVAGLRLCGGSPEFAGRFVAALSSLIVLPAAYLLGKRLQGSLAGWLVVIILCISVWEIEMARFARMYAPFQAVFCWYLVFFLRYGVDKHASALRWMVVLSVLGVLTWEGGALLGIANMFAVLLWHENGRLAAKDWGRLVVLGLLLMVFYLATRDLRGFAEPPAVAGAIEAPSATRLQLAAAWFSPLSLYPGWAGGLLLPFAFAIAALRGIGASRGGWLVGGGCCLALVAAAAHLFTVTAGLLATMLLAGLIGWRTLDWRQARYFWLAIGAFFLFWLVSTVLSQGIAREAALGVTAKAQAAAALERLFGFPDVYGKVLRPWGRTLPMLSLGLAVAVAYLGRNSIVTQSRASNSVRALLGLCTIMVLAVGVTPTERIETRYTFFLYPLAIVFLVSAILSIVHRWRDLSPARAVLATALPVLFFCVTEDFQPRHILAVDSAEINFRLGMSPVRSDHYYPRNDMRAVAQWIADQARPGDVVITGIPTLDEYLPHIDYFFLDTSDDRYESYVCQDGETERWTNHPVLYTMDALKPIVATGRRIFASLYRVDERHLMDYAPAAGWSVTRVWSGVYAKSDVLLIEAGSAAQPPP